MHRIVSLLTCPIIQPPAARTLPTGPSNLLRPARLDMNSQSPRTAARNFVTQMFTPVLDVVLQICLGSAKLRLSESILFSLVRGLHIGQRYGPPLGPDRPQHSLRGLVVWKENSIALVDLPSVVTSLLYFDCNLK